MARIRYIKPDFFRDEDLAEVAYEVRLFFAGLWCYADKTGRLEDRPRRLAADIMPYDQRFDPEKALSILAQPKKNSPVRNPFIIRYEVDGNRYIQIVSWLKHQKPHHTEAESIIPSVPPLKENGEYKGNGKCSASESSNAEPLDNRSLTVKLTFNFGKGTWDGITPTDISSWQSAFPACDIDAELRKMASWLVANPSKKKSNYRRFIHNWLTRCQDGGGTKGKASGLGKSERDITIERIKATFARGEDPFYDSATGERKVPKEFKEFDKLGGKS